MPRYEEIKKEYKGTMTRLKLFFNKSLAANPPEGKKGHSTMAVVTVPFSVHSLPRVSYTSDKSRRLHSFFKPSSVQDSQAKPTQESIQPIHNLLTLPAEIRLQIYGLVLVQTNCFRHSHARHPLQGTALSLLRVNQAIYNEARLLPFQVSEIAFQKWYGSSVFCCTAFLKSIEDWQRREVRTLNLTVNGRELSGWQAREGWLQICEILSVEAPVPGGVRNMTLNINGTRGFNWDDLLKTNSAWVREGLQKLKTVKKLVIVLSSADVEKELVVLFEESLKQSFPVVEVRQEAPPPAEPPLESRRHFPWNL
ncbi:hypothetical protein MMC11_004924 [Xylographa trunciseda]|nr:hypothetical protein [Xylographa trunciseda]